MSRLALHLLGPPFIERDGERVTVNRRKALALLAYLAVTQRDHTRDALATLLWPEHSQSKARAGLRNALTSLRKALGKGCLVVDRESVRLRSHVGLKPHTDPSTSFAQASRSVAERTERRLWLDVDEFRALLAQSRAHGHPPDATCPDCLSALAEAGSLYRDDFMSGFTLADSPAFDEWQFFQSEGLREELARALERLAGSYNERGEYEGALPYARRWLALDPLHEPAQRLLMRLYAGSGQRAAALRQYAECVRVLKEELGVPPDEATTQLYQAIKDKTELPPPGERRAAPIAASVATPKHNLPTPPTPFVGRAALLAEIATRLQEPACRLLTLVGPGGCGKTRLALEAAAARVDAHEHGVFFVSLAPLESVEEIVPSVAQAVGFTFYGAAAGGEAVAPRQQLLDYLRNKSMLLVMDNYEHLLDPPLSSPPWGGTEDASPPGGGGGGGLLTDILQTAPQVKILATSRANLNLQEEHLFPVAGMDFPDIDALDRASDYSAVKLFLEAARRAQPRFAANADNLRDVIRICRLVEGMPLGVLLAAGWVPMLTPAEIATEIEKSLDFLETDLRGVPGRQRSVRAVFDHSWRLLTVQEQEVLAQLSVFRGGFSRRAVQAVTGATLRVLKGLVDKSLLGHTTAPSTGLRAGPATGLQMEGRYDLHELLRQYAAERLEADPDSAHAAHDRHSAYYVGFLARRVADLKSARQQAALTEIEADAENARAAWNWTVEQGQMERLGLAMEGLCLFYEWRGRYEQGGRACQRAAERLAGIRSGYAVRSRARVLTWLAVFDEQLGHNESAQQSLEQSLLLLNGPELSDQDTRSERAFALRQQGNIARWFGRYERARGLFEQSLALYRELEDRWCMAIALVSLGWAAWDLGKFAEAEGWHRESLALRSALADRRGIGESLYGVGLTLEYWGQFEESERLAREFVAISRETGDMVNLGWGLDMKARALVRAGKFAEAHSVRQEIVAIGEELGSRAWLATWLGHLGFVQTAVGRYEDARTQLQLSLKLARETGFNRALAWSFLNLGGLALVEEDHAEAQRCFREAMSVSRATGLKAGLVEALAGLGLAERGLGNLGRAREHLYAGLETDIELGAAGGYPFWATRIALLLADDGETERAVELYALACRYPAFANSRMWQGVVGKHIAAVADTLPPEVVVAAQERGRARDLEATVRELLEEWEA